MTGVVLDLDGVVYRGGVAVPGAGDALAVLVDRHDVLFATNNSRRTPAEVAGAIERATGVAVDPATVLTSALAAAAVADAVPTGVVGGAGIRAALAERGIPVVDHPDARQVVTGIDFDLSYETLRTASAAIADGARWIATNTDATFPAETGLWPGAGAIVAALAVASGAEPEVAGKPHPPMVSLVGALVGTDAVVVGDRPETDLALAKAGGWTSVLVLSGVTDDPATVPAEFAPDHVVGSLVDVVDLLG